MVLLTSLDYPDPDVIRVDNTYYMVSTTMHFMPGCEILRSYDLKQWEHLTYVYDILDASPKQSLVNGEHAYGKGMWAASLRYHKGTFYVCFVANDTGKTYLFRTDDLQGKWIRSEIDGFYHDPSLLFDEENVYIAYGNRNVYLTQLRNDLSGPLEGGLHRLLISDEGNPNLGYEGAHLYKINGKYYLFCIHSKSDQWRRVEACFVADSLEGEFVGGDVFDADMGYCNQGIAQGGIVDTPDGKWYSILFQDRGAVGRIPVLVSVSWEHDFPKFEIDEAVELDNSADTQLFGSDDFKYEPIADTKEANRQYGCFGLKSMWQFNHTPDLSLMSWDKQLGKLTFQTGELYENVTQAKNTLTQKMFYPSCTGDITIDVTKIKDGDYAGLCVLQEDYGMIAVTKRAEKYYLVMRTKEGVQEEVALPDCISKSNITLRATADYKNMTDTSVFYYKLENRWIQIGKEHKLRFSLAHFTGCRFALYYFATKEIGGSVDFMDFRYEV